MKRIEMCPPTGDGGQAWVKLSMREARTVHAKLGDLLGIKTPARRDQRKRDLRPWRIEAWERKGARSGWVARTRFMERDDPQSLTPPYSLHVYAVGYGATREEALRACIANHRRGGHRHWVKP